MKRPTRKAKTTAKLRQQILKLADKLTAAAPAKTQPDPAHVPMEMVDNLEKIRMVAEGIQYAVEGAGRAHTFDSSPLIELLDRHIDALRAFTTELHVLVKAGNA
jgi:hypothetical protein